jgi:plastocyanin domain-containing protein
VTIASGIQRVVIGGHHNMTADTTVVDAKSGAVLLPYPGQSAMAMAGQGLAGVLIDAALLSDPIDRVVDDYMGQYARWFLRR